MKRCPARLWAATLVALVAGMILITLTLGLPVEPALAW